MYCPGNIVISNKYMYVTIHTSGDYNCMRQIPKSQLLNPLRYEIKLRNSITINNNGKWRVKLVNLLYKFGVK